VAGGPGRKERDGAAQEYEGGRSAPKEEKREGREVGQGGIGPEIQRENEFSFSFS